LTLVNLTKSSKFETRKLHSVISQLHHNTTTKHLAASDAFYLYILQNQQFEVYKN